MHHLNACLSLTRPLSGLPMSTGPTTCPSSIMSLEAFAPAYSRHGDELLVKRCCCEYRNDQTRSRVRGLSVRYTMTCVNCYEYTFLLPVLISASDHGVNLHRPIRHVCGFALHPQYSLLLLAHTRPS